MSTLEWEEGSPLPLGATIKNEGVNFSLLYTGKSPLELLIFNPDTLEILHSCPMQVHVGTVFHRFLKGLKPPFGYAYKLPDDPSWILDPYAKEVISPFDWRAAAPYHPVGLVRTASSFDWTGDKKLNYSKEDLIIYEMHLRGFTQHASSGVEHPGTFSGMIEKIPHLVNLGVNAVEFLPLQEFNEKEFPSKPVAGSVCQYWGYSTINFFAVMNRYSSNKSLGGALDEFKQLVKTLHQAGIEVIIDIVLNHTAGWGEKGPFKDLAKNIYYLIDQAGHYSNYSGCGNTLNCNHPYMVQFIIDVLRYWVVEMHVDGFRFDLASVFYRGSNGAPLLSPPVLEAISKDPILMNTKLIAEPWDAAGLYQVGGFFPSSKRWGEWNGRYRDTIRRFVKGDHHLKGDFATRLSGSEDLYGHEGKLPRNSINFITCHDGYTLRDLVSYEKKHNEANLEHNRDGTNQNDSWNCGFEGPTTKGEIINLRKKQMRNFHLALMVSQGIPMIMMGDEYGHTKNGNNNTWCQDNELNWFNWSQLRIEQDFIRFYRFLIQFRKRCPLVRRHRFLRDEDICWHGKKPHEPEWGVEDGFIAFSLLDKDKGHDLYIAFNASKEGKKIALPENHKWHLLIDTGHPAPNDIYEGKGLPLTSPDYQLEPYSSVLAESC